MEITQAHPQTMALVGKVVPPYDESHDTLPPGMSHMVYPSSATTHWTILGDQSQVLHVSLVSTVCITELTR